MKFWLLFLLFFAPSFLKWLHFLFPILRVFEFKATTISILFVRIDIYWKIFNHFIFFTKATKMYWFFKGKCTLILLDALNSPSDCLHVIKFFHRFKPFMCTTHAVKTPKKFLVEGKGWWICVYDSRVYLHRTDNWTVALIGISGCRALCFAWHEYSTKSSSGVGDSWRRDVVVNRLFESITLSSRRSVKYKMKNQEFIYCYRLNDCNSA